MLDIDKLPDAITENNSPSLPASVEAGSWDGYEPEYDCDPELVAFQQETGFATYEEFYENERRIEEKETKEEELISINSYELYAIAFGLQNIADKWQKNCELVVPYEGDKVPKFVIGVFSLAWKIGLRLINKYYDEDYQQWLKTSGRFDEYPLQWYTNEEIDAIEKESLELEKHFKEGRMY